MRYILGEESAVSVDLDPNQDLEEQAHCINELVKRGFTFNNAWVYSSSPKVITLKFTKKVTTEGVLPLPK